MDNPKTTSGLRKIADAEPALAHRAGTGNVRIRLPGLRTEDDARRPPRLVNPSAQVPGRPGCGRKIES